ncbi:uncharacterized protein [Palaemon carinicauda]|uniref:uncharacterized protein n=1 Tax=Palaemon carinicauda TaxID=392227 RepID=UPI0035B60D22
MFVPSLLVCISVISFRLGHGLDCFRCGSFNGSDPHCEDPFHHNYSVHYLASPCLAGWKGRNGLFPASQCVKISGYVYGTHETITVRGCTIDSGTVTLDTELGRQSHCGVMEYDDKYVVGCLDVCDEFDACNSAATLVGPLLGVATMLALFW